MAESQTNPKPKEISPDAKTLLQIISATAPHALAAALSATAIPPTPDVVQDVLRLSYSNPSAAVEFFRWAGLTRKHSAHSWNLIVDLLGKNSKFEPMWDAIRSMRNEGALSLSAFISVFGSYCSVGRVNEAIMSFEVMDRYGIPPDVAAMNALLSAICCEGGSTTLALEFFEKIKVKITPDGDTFMILLEGWEREGNVTKAKSTFGEMVVRLGWSPQNMVAYNSVLMTLVRGMEVEEAIKFLLVMKGKGCLPGLKFFSNALDVLLKQNDSTHAIALWDIMLDGGFMPNLMMYNTIIGILCNAGDADNAFRFLDEMVFYGVFADSFTYNMIFQCLVKHKKVHEAGKFFIEMIKNECPPMPSNCAAAIAMCFDGDDPEMAIEIWSYMIENSLSPVDESANALLIGLCNLRRFSDYRRFAEDMLDMKIKIHESTMEKLKNARYKDGRSARDTCDSLWKSLLANFTSFTGMFCGWW
ncbi:pentatricopeptide repeat-containing protein At1g77360, mitochondrial-like isoform X3 [Vitis riparia]|uniref:pentatricopeptide repeat-containing protein At1g77360, mitochondrial-like isoform X3 n=1 Tax=Vitis riparia TaxID=96939 RepID=UPI00155AD4EF|nr:pentatricopeptide repeat-containing protein At1g77360, mitochondrial-like isoform X3 [Vitis riparia]